MRDSIIALVLSTLMFGCAPKSQEPCDPGEEPAESDPEMAVRAQMDLYRDAFSSLSVDDTLPFYRTPGLLATPTTILALSSPDDVRNVLQQNFDQLAAAHYVGSRFLDLNVYVLSEQAAIVSVLWERSYEDGSTSQNAATYQLANDGGTWQFVSTIIHDPSTVIR